MIADMATRLSIFGGVFFSELGEKINLKNLQF